MIPSHDCAESLTYMFVEHFSEKVELIWNDIETWLNSSRTPSTRQCFCILWCLLGTILCCFWSWYTKIISSSPRELCALDMFPTWLLKQCQDQLAPVRTAIVNDSLSCDEFPPEPKKAFPTLLIMIIILDCLIVKNYRPISNLFFISNLVERVACVQLADNLKTNNLYEIFQSAFKHLHSTKTALLRVHINLLQAVANEGGGI